MSKSVEAIVTPQVLAWARKSAGLDLESAAKKAQVRPEHLKNWEEGPARPTVPQVRRLGQVYKRPLAVFYLPEPPTDFQPLRDFRRLPGVIAGTESPPLRFEMRQAHNRREVALELYELLDETPKDFLFSANLSDNPEEVATKLRVAIGITYESQVKWNPGYEAFNNWRTALEGAGILVFQTAARYLAESEIRGFSIHAARLPAIIVNNKDAIRARIFTMLHELTHIALREGGICDLYEDYERPPEEQKIEIFCNSVAGATLVPRQNLLREQLVMSKRGQIIWTDDEIGQLANHYGASREVLLRRLLICGCTTEKFYQTKRSQLLEEYETVKQGKEEAEKEIIVPQHRKALSKAGMLLARLVLDNYRQGTITASDVADFLDVRLKHLTKIEAAVFRAI